MQFSGRNVCVPIKISQAESVKNFGLLDFNVLIEESDRFIEESELRLNMSKMIPRFVEYCCCVQNAMEDVANIDHITTTFGKLLSYLCLLQIFGEDLRKADLSRGKSYGSSSMIDDVELNSLLDSTSKSFLISVEIRYCFSGENASFSHTLTYSGVKHMGITSILGNLLIGQDSTKWGLVDILNKPEDTAEIVVLKIAPGKEIPWHLHHIMRETEILLDFGLICQGIQVDFDSDSLRIWERKEPHCYVNRSINWKLVLCIDLPRFIFSDEVEIPNFSISSLNFKKTLSLPDVQTLVWKLNFRHGCFFSFPGGISAEKQLITMNIGYEQSQKIPHAVSACIIAMGNTFDSHEILLVRHSVRGWELPGGKVELNERATDALFRELSEESGFDMLGSGILSSDEASKITPMIQYFISSKASQDVHIKSIYGIKLSERPALPKSLDNETECSQFFNLQALMHGSLPELSSSLIKDLVFQICMKFSFVK